MSTPPGIQLLQHLITDHYKDEGGRHRLIPCMHEELEKDIGILRAGAQRCEGALYHLTAVSSDWMAPKGPLNPLRKGLVEAILADAGDALPGKMLITERLGQIEAHIDGQHGPPEPSLVPILRIAAVIASDAFDEHDLVMMTAIATTTDPKRRELLWRLLTIDPDDLAIGGRSTTIVPIIGAPVDADIDYRRRPSIRYVTRWDRVILRSQSSRERTIDTIAKLEGPLVLFLGAGASASANIPLGNTYRDRALADLVGDAHTGSSAAEDFFDLLHDRGRFIPGDSPSRSQFAEKLTLERVLLEAFGQLGYRPRTSLPIIQEIVKDCDDALSYERPGRKALRELAARMPGRLILITVNFDQLIETDLGVPCEVFYRPVDYRDKLDRLLSYVSGDPGQPIPILKLHGSINDPDSLVATIDTTSAGLHENVQYALTKMLETVETPLRWVWIGCSMRDLDVNQWLGGLGPRALDEWWVDPLPGVSLDEFFVTYRAHRWKQIDQDLRDRLIIDSADRFLRDLAALL